MSFTLDFDSTSMIFTTILGFILGLFSAWSWQILPHKLVKLFDTDRRAQLVVLYLLFTFTLQYFNPEYNLRKVLINAFYMFFIYLFITKQSLISFIITMIGICIITLLTNNIQYHTKKIDEEKSEEKKNDRKKIVILNTKLRNYSIVLTVIVIIIGVVRYYMCQLKDHYKKGESILVFTLRFLFEGGNEQRKTTGYVISK
tara:strand:+ start:676 stop:1275 length:600 start_codon:yes stop_codon:yes gene_type:complete